MGTIGDTSQVLYQIIDTDELDDKITDKQFGIMCVDVRGKVLKQVDNISTEYAFVKQLVDLLNEEHVEVCHLENIIEDSIY